MDNFTTEIELSDLDGSNGFTLNGISITDRSGGSVSAAGDVNGDGIDDIIIGAIGAEGNRNDAGESYVVFGSTSGFSADFELSSLLARNGGDGSTGFVLNGIFTTDFSGESVSAAGDVNGDGIDDILIGASSAELFRRESGESYVVFGSASGFSADFDLSSLLAFNGGDRGDGSTGFVLNGIDSDDRSGGSVSAAGDVNGDGIDDIIIGASSADPNGFSSGESYVVFGSAAGFSADFDLSSLLVVNGGDGTAGFVLNGIDSIDLSGTSVSAAGDVNGDGIDDIIIGASSADPNGVSSGESYIVFGSTSGFSAEFELSSLLAVNGGDGSTGFVLNGIDADDRSGSFVSAAGDVNGDGIDDILIGARLADPNGDASGESYVVFGSTSGFSADFELSSLLTVNGGDGTAGFVLNGIDANDSSGTSVSAAGDVNGDGIDDIIIGASGGDPNGSGSGETYIVFGSAAGFSAEFELSSLLAENGGDGSTGIILNGIDEDDNSGTSVSAAGDVNGDGIDDILIGADEADPNGSRSGESYVVFGSRLFGPPIVISGTNGNDVIDGVGNDIIFGFVGDDIIFGLDGNDTINAGSGDDIVEGGVDNDIIHGGNGEDIIDGGSGDDTLRGGGDDDIIDGGVGSDAISAGIGDDMVRGGGNNDSILGQGGADTLYGDGGADALRGGSGNDTLFGGDGADQLFGQGNNDILYGEGGNDALSGAAGSDQLFGGAGNDRLNGFIGGDRLDGGTGNDVLHGGGQDGARDTFVFAEGYDEDRINSFDQAGNDRLELDDALWDGLTLTGQEVVDMFGSLNGAGSILTLDFGDGDILEVQSAAGIDIDTFGLDILII